MQRKRDGILKSEMREKWRFANKATLVTVLLHCIFSPCPIGSITSDRISHVPAANAINCDNRELDARALDVCGPLSPRQGAVRILVRKRLVDPIEKTIMV